MAARRRTGRTHGALMAGLSAFGMALGHLLGLLVLYSWRLLGFSSPPSSEALAEALRKGPDWLVSAGQGSQVAVGVVLLSGAWLAGRSPLERIGALAYVSGVALAVRYLTLSVLAGWPDNLQAVDQGLGPAGTVAVRVWVVLGGAATAMALGLGLISFARRSVP
ncbi:MAG: hypothetical protein HPY69_09780 [Armatimonadetes bacterium]|nr:hypothetical protein [Armatimonadota bacterium]